jgi:hypothetical protein
VLTGPVIRCEHGAICKIMARSEMGSTLFGQEYECAFNDAAGSYFAAADIDAMWADLPVFDLLDPPRPLLTVVREGRAS